jgi:hypothetical protein
MFGMYAKKGSDSGGCILSDPFDLTSAVCQVEYNRSSVHDKYVVKLELLILPIDRLKSLLQCIGRLCFKFFKVDESFGTFRRPILNTLEASFEEVTKCKKASHCLCFLDDILMVSNKFFGEIKKRATRK